MACSYVRYLMYVDFAPDFYRIDILVPSVNSSHGWQGSKSENKYMGVFGVIGDKSWIHKAFFSTTEHLQVVYLG